MSATRNEDWLDHLCDNLWEGRTPLDAMEARFEIEAIIDEPAYPERWYIESMELLGGDEWNEGVYMTLHKADYKL